MSMDEMGAEEDLGDMDVADAGMYMTLNLQGVKISLPKYN